MATSGGRNNGKASKPTSYGLNYLEFATQASIRFEVIHQVAFEDRTNSVSNNVRVELGQLADAYGVQPPKPSPPR